MRGRWCLYYARNHMQRPTGRDYGTMRRRAGVGYRQRFLNWKIDCHLFVCYILSQQMCEGCTRLQQAQPSDPGAAPERKGFYNTIIHERNSSRRSSVVSPNRR